MFNDSSLSGLAVLVVEADPHSLESAVQALSGRAGAVHTAADGNQGLFACTRHQPDMLVTAARLPKMDGLALAKAVRAMYPEMPIVLVAEPEDREVFLQAMDVGVDRHLSAPLDPQQLVAALEACARSANRAKALEEQKQLTDLMLQGLPFPTVLLSQRQRTVLQSNKAARRLGYEPGSGLTGPLFPRAVADAAVRPLHEDFRDTLDPEEFPDIKAHDRTWIVSLSHISLESVLLTALDVTEQRRLELELVRLAATDPLTGVSNRRSFLERAEEEVVRSRRYARPLSFLMLDVDNFKRINDTLGHDAGDQVLRHLAETSLAVLRQSDCMGRLGGEEFGYLLPETDGPTALEVAQRLRHQLSLCPAVACGQSVSYTVSIGAATLGRDKDGLENLMKRADEALYQAKGSGKDRVVYKGVED